MSTMIWKDPPPAGDGRPSTKTQRFAQSLKRYPGRWALYKTCTTPSAAGACSARLKDEYGLEACSRGREVYARWPVPSEDNAQPVGGERG